MRRLKRVPLRLERISHELEESMARAINAKGITQDSPGLPEATLGMRIDGIELQRSSVSRLTAGLRNPFRVHELRQIQDPG